MVKSLTSTAMDAALDYVATRADQISLCSGAPTTVAEAMMLASGGGKSLASVNVTEGVGNGDFSITTGTISGRRLAVAAQSAVPISETGTVDHIALVDSTGGELLVVTQLTEAQAVTAGEVLSIKAFGAEVRDPA